MNFQRRVIDALKRRRRLIAIVSLICLAGLLATYTPAEQVQRIEMHFIVGQEPLVDSTLITEEERYFRWVASEYIVYGVHDWASATLFAEEVSERMIAAGYDDYNVEEVDSNMYASVQRSRLLLGVVAGDEETVKDFAEIATSVLLEQAGAGIPQLQNEPAAIFPIDPLADPLVTQISQTISDQTALPIRLVIGMLSGFIVAAVVELFDPTIRYRDAAKRLNLPLLGEIPKA